MNTPIVTLDRYTRLLLTALVVLLTIIAVELWVARPSGLPTAHAQIPDTALQRKQIVDEGKRTNELLEQILNHLKSKPILVRMSADEKGGPERQGPHR